MFFTPRQVMTKFPVFKRCEKTLITHTLMSEKSETLIQVVLLVTPYLKYC